MQRRHIAVLGITLAMSSTALWAAPGDAWEGTYKDEDKVRQPPMESAPLRPESSLRDEERAAAHASPEFIPVVPRESLAPESQRNLAEPPYDPRHPHTGQLIERGLFNRTGPNDFGA